MSFSFYDAVVPANLQILGALDGVMEKAKAFCDERGLTEAELIDARLAPDMFPLGYQVKSCAVHSIGGIEGTQVGGFSPDRSTWPTEFDGLRGILQRASAALSALDRVTVDELTDTDTHFAFGETKLPFTGANFLLSFSQPNFYFHATTVRDLASAGREPREARFHGDATHQAIACPSGRRAAGGRGGPSFGHPRLTSGLPTSVARSCRELCRSSASFDCPLQANLSKKPEADYS